MMRTPMWDWIKIILIALAILILGATANASPKYPVIRKLHLVRPDLILYPVQYEVWC